MSNYVSYGNAAELMQAVADRFASLGSVMTERGSRTFAELPTVLTGAMKGYVYNVTDEFTTDARFREGAGKKYPAGTNVVVADDGTEQSPVYKLDVLGSLLDTTELEGRIKAVSDMVSGEFDPAASYEPGDVVVHEGALYKCTAAHAGAWDAGDFAATTVAELVTQANPDALTAEQVSALIALL